MTDRMTTPVLPLNAETAIDLLKQVVGDKGPEYVYVNAEGHRAGEKFGIKTAECSYVHVYERGAHMEPGCLVGHVLHRAGVSLMNLHSYEGVQPGMFAQDAGWADEDAALLLIEAQAVQDRGATWGEALEAALNMAEIIDAGRPADAGGE